MNFFGYHVSPKKWNLVPNSANYFPPTSHTSKMSHFIDKRTEFAIGEFLTFYFFLTHSILKISRVLFFVLTEFRII